MKTIFIQNHFFPIFFDDLTESKEKIRKSINYSSVRFFDRFYETDGLTEPLFKGVNPLTEFDGSFSNNYTSLRQLRQSPKKPSDGDFTRFDGRKSATYILLRQIIPEIKKNPVKNMYGFTDLRIYGFSCRRLTPHGKSVNPSIRKSVNPIMAFKKSRPQPTFTPAIAKSVNCKSVNL
jgi:hypothetical protein